MDYKVAVAQDDGNDSQVVTPELSKWVIGTIVGLFPANQDFGWAEQAGFVLLNGRRTKAVDQFRMDVGARKVGMHVSKYMNATEKQKYLTNRNTINIKFRKDQETMGYKAAEEKYRKMFQDTGTKPDWGITVDLDDQTVIFTTPEWQHVKEEAEILEP